MKSQVKYQEKRNYFSTNLKYLRERAKLKQPVIANLLGVKGNSISNYEHDKSSPKLDQLEKIIKFFDISMDDLLFKNLSEKAHLISSPGEDEKAHLKAHLNTHLNEEKHQGPVVNLVQSEEIEYGGRRYPTGSPTALAQNIIQLSLSDEDVVVIYKAGGQFKADLLAGALKPDWQAKIDQLKADITELKRFYNVK